jgi:hypothetical protein
MPTLETVSIISAKDGEAVELEKPEYDLVDGGKVLRETKAVKQINKFNRAGVASAISQMQAKIAELEAVIVAMDSIGIE